MAGTVVRGNSEDRVKLLFRLLGVATDKSVPSSAVESFVSRVVLAACNAMAPDGKWDADARVMAKSLMHVLVAPGTTAKSVLREE